MFPRAVGANPTPIAIAEVPRVAERHRGRAGEPAAHHRRDRKIFSDVLWEASTRASGEIRTAELAGDFEKRGKTVVRVDRGPFIQAVQKAVTAPDAPWPRELYDRVEAIR